MHKKIEKEHEMLYPIQEMLLVLHFKDQDLRLLFLITLLSDSS